MRTISKATAALVALAALTAGPAAAANHDGDRGRDRGRVDCTRDDEGGRRSLVVVGLTADQRLICFDERRPDRASAIGSVVGLDGDTALVGVDYRPATGELFGLGNAGGLYVLDPESAGATKRAQLNVALAGASFGVDFNPTVDRLRVVSDTGQNLRVNPDTGATTVDGALNDGAAPPVTLLGITGAAYTNNDGDPGTATTLFDADTARDRIAIQAPPNAGTQNPTGGLRVDSGLGVGFDIHSTLRGGTTVEVRALASLPVGGGVGLFGIDLFTGAASHRGTFAPSDQVIGLAIPLDQL